MFLLAPSHCSTSFPAKYLRLGFSSLTALSTTFATSYYIPRRYILDLLTDHPMTGKEIIDKATVQSHGKWRPSPGLIYPMLGRLLEEGLIAETDNGRYKITRNGLDMAADLQAVSNIFEKQMDIMSRIGNIGKFMSMDLIDRVSTMG